MSDKFIRINADNSFV